MVSNADFRRLGGGKGSAAFKIGLHTYQNPCTGLTVATDKDTDTVVSAVRTFTCLEMRFLKLTPLIKTRDINASLRSFPKEYIPEFPFVNRFLCFTPYHIKVMGNVISYTANLKRCGKKTFFIHRCACVLGVGGRLENKSLFLEEIWRQEQRGKQMVIYQLIRKNRLLAAREGKMAC